MPSKAVAVLQQRGLWHLCDNSIYFRIRFHALQPSTSDAWSEILNRQGYVVVRGDGEKALEDSHVNLQEEMKQN